jgi:hypothetical protein
MKARTLEFGVVGLFLLLALLGTLAAGAQGPEESDDPQAMGSQDKSGLNAFSHPITGSNPGAQEVSAPAVDLGEPGLSFRHGSS